AKVTMATAAARNAAVATGRSGFRTAPTRPSRGARNRRGTSRDTAAVRGGQSRPTSRPPQITASTGSATSNGSKFWPSDWAVIAPRASASAAVTAPATMTMSTPRQAARADDPLRRATATTTTAASAPNTTAGAAARTDDTAVIQIGRPSALATAA